MNSNKGINFLYETYKKDPTKIEKLLEGIIEISEKLDGSRFLVQKDEGDRLLFFKRKDVMITKIDRTLSKYYDKALYHFENLDDSKISQFPEGWRFAMEYFPNLKPVTISYDKLPLNNLVLTDIQVKDPKNKTIDVISDKETLKKWSEILEVENPPIIFEGKLSDSQRKKILDFLNTPYTSLIKRFNTESFTSFILNLLNPELKTSFLQNDTEKDIDGLIFRFNGKEAYRVSNPEIVVKKQDRKEDKPSDIYSLTLVTIQEFVTSLDFRKIKLFDKTFEDRYIEFISVIFNKFVNSNTYKINFEKGVDFELPHFLTRNETDVNFSYVKNLETKKYLELSNTNRELYKIMIASLRSHKKKPVGFFTKDLIFYHNQLVDKIADYISTEMHENAFFSFNEFKSVFLTESEYTEDFGKELNEDIESLDLIEGPNQVEKPIEFPTYDQAVKQIDRKSVLEFFKKFYAADSSSANSDKSSKNKVCLMKGKFLPFHNGHESIIEDAKKMSGLDIYIAVLDKKLSKAEFEESLHKNMLDEVVKNNKNVKGYIFTKEMTLDKIEKSLPNNTKICAFAGSEDECEDAKIERGEDFPSFSMTKHITSESVMKKIKEEDHTNYKKLVPSYLHNYFYKIKNELSKQ